MSVAYYIVLDNDEPGFETFVNGKAVAHAQEELDALCDANDVPKLDAFMGQSLDDIADSLGEDLEMPDELDGEATWFSAAEGIAAIDRLIKVVEQNRQAMASAAEVLEDLAEYKAVLVKAQAIGAQWHLALDF